MLDGLPPVDDQSSAPKGALPKNQQDQDLLTVARGGGIVFIATLATRIINYIYMAVLIWGLGGESFGLFILALAIVYFFGVLAELGLGLGVVRFGAIRAHISGQASIHKITMLALKISIPIGIFFLMALVAGRVQIAEGVFHKPQLAILIGVLSWVVPVMPAQSLLLAATKTLKIMKYSAYVWVVQPLTALLFAILLLALKLDVQAVALSFVVSYYLGLCLALFFYLRLIPRVDCKDSAAVRVGQLIKFSLPLSMTQWIQYANERTELFFLGLLSSAVNVGIYRIAWSLAGLETMLRLSMEEILGPFSSDLSHRKEIKQLEALYKTTAKWSFTGALILFLIYLLFGTTIMNLFEPAFVSGVGLLIILGLAQLGNEITGACGTILIMSGRSDLSLLNTVILFIASITLDWTLIPRYGLIGAGLAGGLTIVIVNFLRVMEVWLLLKIHPLRWSFFKPVIAGLVSASMVFALRRFVFSGALIMDTAYAVLFISVFIAILVFEKIDADDAVILNAMKRKLMGLKTFTRGTV